MSRETETKKQLSEDDEDDVMVLLKDLRKKWKPETEESAGDGEDLSRVLIKDLRLRRVYSPQSGVHASSDQKIGVVDSDLKDKMIGDLGFGSPSSVEKEGSKVNGESETKVNDGVAAMVVATESPNLGLSQEVPDFNQGNTGLSDESSILQDRKQCDEKIVGNSSENVGDSKTTLDAGDTGKLLEEVYVCAGNAEKNVGEGFHPNDDIQRNYSPLKGKSVLEPCSNEKLFEIPVSYERMFPYPIETMGDDSGKSKSGYRQEDEKGVNSEQEFQLPLLSQSQEGSKFELKTVSCTVGGTSQLGASEGDAGLAQVNELSHGNGSKLISPPCFSESPMQLQAKEVTRECLSAPSLNDICLGGPEAGSVTDFQSVKDVSNALHNDNIKHDSSHKSNLDHAKETSHGGCTSEQFGVLNEECVLTTPPDAVICDNPEVNLSQLGSTPRYVHHVKPMGLARSNLEIAGEGFSVKADKRKDSVLRSKSVPRPNLHKRLFRTPGSISYRRMLPFWEYLTKDDSVKSEFCHQTLHQNGEVDMHAKKFKLPLSTHGEVASIDEQHKIDSCPTYCTAKCNALVNNVLADLANELSPGNQPQLTPSQGLPETPMQLDAKGVHNLLSAPSVGEHMEKVEIDSEDISLSDSKFDLCSVIEDSQCAKNVANAVQNDGFEQLQNKTSRQNNSESTPDVQNLLYINGDISSLAFEHCSSKEKGSTIVCDEKKQFEGMENCESVIRNPPEGQSQNLDSNLLDAEKEASSHAIIGRDDVVVSNHISVTNEEPRTPSEKITFEKSDMPRHGNVKAESSVKGIVSGPLKGSNKNARCDGEIRNCSEYKTTLALNRCSRVKLSKHAGSFSYKRMRPFIESIMKDNSCASVIEHNPKLQKCLDLPISASDLRVTPVSDSNSSVPLDHFRGNSGTQQQTELLAHDLNNDSSSPISPSHHQNEQIVLDGCCNSESSPDLSISDLKIDSPITPLGPTVNDAITREETITAIPVSSVYPEVKGNSSFSISSNGEKTPETHETQGYCQRLSQKKVLEQLRVPAVNFKKGILKRNPRGCRGHCTCLNCVSFRLNAERAFEFSRNQLLDAEEVALDLIKELSHLRNMLHRSADRVNGNPSFDANQVEEACEKAFATEQLAKDRLSQMNDELNIHCRTTSLQRPSVRFADNVEEKVFQPDR
ncbi:hypothetical protein RIF29_41914 [Crotalaria pallida]|uniref:Uncharacterized protein n=1 Tax=Crotalaria pallida TaxID=3830 RepID=A0AAN9HVT4_CROPI